MNISPTYKIHFFLLNNNQRADCNKPNNVLKAQSNNPINTCYLRKIDRQSKSSLTTLIILVNLGARSLANVRRRLQQQGLLCNKLLFKLGCYVCNQWNYAFRGTGIARTIRIVRTKREKYLLER